MTNKFLSKGTPFRPEPGPPASTDHFLPDEGIDHSQQSTIRSQYKEVHQ
jgi:hypothetical protein